MREFIKYIRQQNKVHAQFFDEMKDEIAYKNITNLRITSIAGLIVFFTVCAYSPFLLKHWSLRIEYIALIPTLLIFYYVSSLIIKKRAHDYYLIMMLCVIFYVVIIGNIINICVFPYPEETTIIYPLSILFFSVVFLLPSYIGVSLLVSADIVFIIFSYFNKYPNIFPQDVFTTITTSIFTFILMWIFGNLRASDSLNKKTLEELSSIDALTAVLNKGSAVQQVESVLHIDHHTPGCLIIIDIDDFKHINDEYGHLVGDSILALLGEGLLSSFRSTDIVGRIGGDEFIIYLKKLGDIDFIESKISMFHQRFQRRVSEKHNFDISCTFGGIVIEDENLRYKEAFEMADNLLYESKREGKNRILIRSTLSYHMKKDR